MADEQKAYPEWQTILRTAQAERLIELDHAAALKDQERLDFEKACADDMAQWLTLVGLPAGDEAGSKRHIDQYAFSFVYVDHHRQNRISIERAIDLSEFPEDWNEADVYEMMSMMTWFHVPLLPEYTEDQLRKIRSDIAFEIDTLETRYAAVKERAINPSKNPILSSPDVRPYETIGMDLANLIMRALRSEGVFE